MHYDSARLKAQQLKVLFNFVIIIKILNKQIGQFIHDDTGILLDV